MKRGKIPLREYATLALQFDPEKFDAQAWVRVFKAAGARYIVIYREETQWPTVVRGACYSKRLF